MQALNGLIIATSERPRSQIAITVHVATTALAAKLHSLQGTGPASRPPTSAGQPDPLLTLLSSLLIVMGRHEVPAAAGESVLAVLRSPQFKVITKCAGLHASSSC